MHLTHPSAPHVPCLTPPCGNSHEASSRPHLDVIPTYAHTTARTRERIATERDLDDLHSLQALAAIVLRAHREVCAIEPPRHPERRWDVRDLLDMLSDTLTNIAAERDRIRNSPVTPAETM